MTLTYILVGNCRDKRTRGESGVRAGLYGGVCCEHGDGPCGLYEKAHFRVSCATVVFSRKSLYRSVNSAET
jgi:hypothetical protein